MKLFIALFGTAILLTACATTPHYPNIPLKCDSQSLAKISAEIERLTQVSNESKDRYDHTKNPTDLAVSADAIAGAVDLTAFRTDCQAQISPAP